MRSDLLPEDKNKVGVYIIQNNNTMESYIGSGILEERLRYHEHNLKGGLNGAVTCNDNPIKHINKKLQESFNKDPNNFEFISIIVEEPNATLDQNRKIALDIEQGLLDEFKNNDLLLNKSSKATSSMSGKKHSEESKLKMSIIQTEISIKLNKQLPAGAIEKSAAIRKGKPLGDQHKNKLLLTRLGSKRTGQALENLKKGQEKRMKKVEADGVVYRNKTEAGDAHNINRTTVHSRINNDNFPNWKFV